MRSWALLLLLAWVSTQAVAAERPLSQKIVRQEDTIRVKLREDLPEARAVYLFTDGGRLFRLKSFAAAQTLEIPARLTGSQAPTLLWITGDGREIRETLKIPPPATPEKKSVRVPLPKPVREEPPPPDLYELSRATLVLDESVRERNALKLDPEVRVLPCPAPQNCFDLELQGGFKNLDQTFAVDEIPARLVRERGTWEAKARVASPDETLRFSVVYANGTSATGQIYLGDRSELTRARSLSWDLEWRAGLGIGRLDYLGLNGQIPLQLRLDARARRRLEDSGRWITQADIGMRPFALLSKAPIGVWRRVEGALGIQREFGDWIRQDSRFFAGISAHAARSVGAGSGVSLNVLSPRLDLRWEDVKSTDRFRMLWDLHWTPILSSGEGIRSHWIELRAQWRRTQVPKNLWTPGGYAFSAEYLRVKAGTRELSETNLTALLVFFFER